MSAVSNLRPLVVRWLENITRATRSSCARARAATRRLTTAAAVSPGGVTAATSAPRTRGTRACAGPRASTTTGIPKKGKRCIGSRRQTGARVGLLIPWGITAAARNPESYEHVRRRRLMPSRRPMPPLSAPLSSKRPSWLASQRSLISGGSWLRGRSCSRPRAYESEPRRAVPSADGKVASTRSCPSSGGGDAHDAERKSDV